MSRLSVLAVTGLFVLLAGAVVVYALVAGPIDGPVAATPVPTQPAPQVIEVPPPAVEGIEDSVQRVLYSSGKAEALSVEDLSELPPEVARILVYYGVTLAIPSVPGVTG